VAKKLMTLKEPLPYSKRLELKSVLDINADVSTESATVVALQANFMPAMPEQQAGGRQAPNVSKSRLEVNNLGTDTQNLLTNSELA
jgi:hypothetical protein